MRLRPRSEPRKETSLIESIRPTLIRLACGYALLVVLVPIVAYLFVLFTGKNNTVSNIARLYLLTSSFFKGVAESQLLFPGPRDFVLAAIVLLYRRRWKISLGLLVVSGFVYIAGVFLLDLVTKAIIGLGPTSAAGLIVESLLTALIVLTSGAILFGPAIASYKEQMKWRIILPCNLLFGFIPPVWILLAFFSLKSIEIKSRKTKKEIADVSTTAATPQLHSRELKKRTKGTKKKKK